MRFKTASMLRFFDPCATTAASADHVILLFSLTTVLDHNTTRSHTHTQIHTRTCTHTQTHMHTFTRTHSHAQTHIHTHTYKQYLSRFHRGLRTVTQGIFCCSALLPATSSIKCLTVQPTITPQEPNHCQVTHHNRDLKAAGINGAPSTAAETAACAA